MTANLDEISKHIYMLGQIRDKVIEMICEMDKLNGALIVPPDVSSWKVALNTSGQEINVKTIPIVSYSIDLGNMKISFIGNIDYETKTLFIQDQKKR